MSKIDVKFPNPDEIFHNFDNQEKLVQAGLIPVRGWYPILGITPEEFWGKIKDYDLIVFGVTGYLVPLESLPGGYKRMSFSLAGSGIPVRAPFYFNGKNIMTPGDDWLALNMAIREGQYKMMERWWWKNDASREKIIKEYETWKLSCG